MTAETNQKIVIPGEMLFKVTPEYEAGRGTYVVHNQIYASLAGFLHLEPSANEANVKIVEVRRSLHGKHSVPFVGATVTCKVTQTTARFVKCSILCVEECILPHPYSGLLRKEDIRETEKDSVDIFNCFRTGDIFLARVISLGDVQSCLLSTTEDTLGVTWGRCQEGHKMVPSSFSKIKCPMCDIEETRKIAQIPIS